MSEFGHGWLFVLYFSVSWGLSFSSENEINPAIKMRGNFYDAFECRLARPVLPLKECAFRDSDITIKSIESHFEMFCQIYDLLAKRRAGEKRGTGIFRFFSQKEIGGTMKIVGDQNKVANGWHSLRFQVARNGRRGNADRLCKLFCGHCIVVKHQFLKPFGKLGKESHRKLFPLCQIIERAREKLCDTNGVFRRWEPLPVKPVGNTLLGKSELFLKLVTCHGILLQYFAKLQGK